MPTNRERANALRFLALDAIDAAKSGHPGAPLGMADIAEVLWNDFLVHNPENTGWSNRDRFVLSNGHASMLLYGLLHLSGYDLSLADLKKFRQIHSKTPGHPEYGLTPGVEVTTGPLGQGIASAVGMAIAERALAATFNKEGFNIVDHFTYVLLGDGCMMEGISHEACSFAGALGLGKLIALWDDNGISIDGKIDQWFADDTPARFAAYGWHVIRNVDGHDPQAIKKALAKARKETARPSLICCKTVIGYGSPNLAGSEKTHGSPFGEEETAATRKKLGWPHAAFEIPAAIKAEWDAKKCGKKAEDRWRKLFDGYRAAWPELAAEFERRLSGEFPAGWEAAIEAHIAATQKEVASEATRISGQNTLTVLGPALPELFGGSADLTPSVGTCWKNAGAFTRETPLGRHLSYGVREFGMSAIMNGMAVHGGFIPYGGTFLTFADYAKSAIRTAALMNLRSIWVLTHDSILLGEDGPTHQPVEHISSLRLTPNVDVWRPCDAVETAIAWQGAIKRADGPSCLILSRQGLPVCPRDAKTLEAVRRGAYILRTSKGQPDVIFIATGSEVALALAAADALEKKDIKTRVVSMPCAEIFDRQDREWKELVLPHNVRARVAVEAASADYWNKYVGLDGKIVAMRSFGESAPGKAAYEYFGFTVERVVEAAKNAMKACVTS